MLVVRYPNVQVSAPKPLFSARLSKIYLKIICVWNGNMGGGRETDDDNEENPRPEGFRSHSSEGHHITRISRYDGAGGREQTIMERARRVKDATSDQGHSML